jgi:hypothetical protein
MRFSECEFPGERRHLAVRRLEAFPTCVHIHQQPHECNSNDDIEPIQVLSLALLATTSLLRPSPSQQLLTMETGTQSRILELAAEIQHRTQCLHDCLVTDGQPLSSFELDTPPALKLSLEGQAHQDALFEAMHELQEQ